MLKRSCSEDKLRLRYGACRVTAGSTCLGVDKGGNADAGLRTLQHVFTSSSTSVSHAIA